MPAKHATSTECTPPTDARLRLRPASPRRPRRPRGGRALALGAGYAPGKRLLDILGAGLGLLLLLPLIAFCAAWIWLMDGGPVFYWQWRVGRHGWLFRIYKLRTMRRDAERDGQARFARSADPRIIRGCHWMRRCHADELPQLWNILVGQMSLVGPRPERPEMLDWLGRSIPGIERRLLGLPGLTGLAQLSQGYTNDLAGARRKLAYDLRYLRHRSLWNEVRLVLGTLPRIWDRAAI